MNCSTSSTFSATICTCAIIIPMICRALWDLTGKPWTAFVPLCLCAVAPAVLGPWPLRPLIVPPLQQLRQLGDPRRDLSSLILGHELRYRQRVYGPGASSSVSSGLRLEIHVSHGKAIGVADDLGDVAILRSMVGSRRCLSLWLSMDQGSGARHSPASVRSYLSGCRLCRLAPLVPRLLPSPPRPRVLR
jgi:hypothetical protein